LIEWLLTFSTAGAVAALLWAIRTDAQWHRLLKMAAASGFIGVALAVGATDTAFGRVVVGALALSWIGDLLLTYRGRTAFLGGLGAFLLAHVAYALAFAVRGVELPHALELITIVGAGILATRWLMPHLDRKMRGPVGAYVIAITVMVVLAGATAGFDPDMRLRLGALAFYLSDLTVARDRFVAAGFVNRATGLPLYFGGQLLLAWSAGG
jgi:uncharacterized membrane protein YhhN